MDSWGCRLRFCVHGGYTLSVLRFGAKDSTVTALTASESTVKPKRAPRPRVNFQPIEAARHPEARLTIGTYCAFYGKSPSTAFREIREGKLEVVRHGTRCTRIVAASAAKLNSAEASQ